MTRTPEHEALLARYGITPCHGSSCIFGRPGSGQMTGGCACMNNLDTRDTATRVMLQRMGAALCDATAEVTRLRAALGEALDMAEMMYTEFTALERVRLDRTMVDASGVPDHIARLRTLAGKET
jgi:hypothetical protein